MSENKYHAIRYIIKYFAPYKLALFGVFIALCFTSSSVLGLGKGIEYLIDQGFSSHNQHLLNKSLIVLLFIITLLSIATFIRAYLINSIAEKVVAAIRSDVYSHIIKLDPGFFETSKTSDIISRLATDSTVLNSIIGSVVSVSLRNVLMLAGGIFLLVSTSGKLSLYVGILLPLVIIPIITLGKKVRSLAKVSQGNISLLSSQIEESLNGIKTVQAFVREEYEIGNFTYKVKTAQDSAISWIRYRGFLAAIVIMMVFSSIVIVLWIGGMDVISGQMSAGALSSFIFYSIIVASSIGGLSEVFGDIQRAAGACDRLFELLNIKSNLKDGYQTLPNNEPEQIKFTNISFSYPARPDFKAINNFNLEIKQGEKIALVGPSGAGKTTLFQLLLRFYDPSSGTIYIDNIDIKTLKTKLLREQFALVSQDPVIFSASGLDNIRYGKIDASEDEVRAAAAQAEILDFLMGLPQGIHTFLGEKGVRISGGQKQRIAIARVIIKDPKILLLDEATSSLDNENEKLVQLAVQKLMQGRTTIIIAHRLSTIVNCDRIVVVDNGAIDAIGTHATLLKTNGLYARLAASAG